MNVCYSLLHIYLISIPNDDVLFDRIPLDHKFDKIGVRVYGEIRQWCLVWYIFFVLRHHLILNKNDCLFREIREFDFDLWSLIREVESWLFQNLVIDTVVMINVMIITLRLFVHLKWNVVPGLYTGKDIAHIRNFREHSRILCIDEILNDCQKYESFSASDILLDPYIYISYQQFGVIRGLYTRYSSLYHLNDLPDEDFLM